MKLASRIVAFALLLCAPVAAHAAPDDSLRLARLGVSAGVPEGRYVHSAIVDEIGRRMVMYGGSTFPISNHLWEMPLDGASTWSPIPAGTVPAPTRAAHVAVTDPVRHRMVVFGGVDQVGRRSDTWTFSLDTGGGWSQLAVAGTPPSPRSLHCGIYDPLRDRLIVFGGYEDGAYLGDVWALTLSGTPTWELLAVEGTPPIRRRECSAIYDPIRDRMIIFGGTNGSFYHDVYALSLGGAPTWTRLDPAGVWPSPRSGQSAVYDPARDVMWMFGGRDLNGTILNDLWTLSLSGTPAWVQQSPAGTLPGVRVYHSAVMDRPNDRMVVFAGYNGGLPNDTWFLQLTGNPTWYPLGSEPPAPPTQPDPRFVATPSVSPITIELGQSFTVSVSVRNHGTASDDGVISMSFPGFTDPGDGQWVESVSSGDTPGYSEFPAGSAMLTAACQPMTATALAVEYRDDAWGAFNAEQNDLSVTVRPQAVGTFDVYVRSTMRKSGTSCDYVNAIPPGGGPTSTDQQGWVALRLAVTVVDAPAPNFGPGVSLSSSTIVLGQTFTISTAVTNTGTASDDGRIAISFPGLTDPADDQWVSSTSTGDTPGYLEHPAGATLTDANCQPLTASYLLVEYADDAWQGLGVESNTLSLTVRPKAAGIFYFYVRSSMRKSGTACEYVNALPAGGMSGINDQQGRAVIRFAVTVSDAPAPVFVSNIVLSATTIELGQTFTVTATASNTGASTDDGRIAISFPGLADPADDQWVSSTAAGDTPGYLEHPAGSPLTNTSCQPLTASYLLVEYVDGDWQGLGAETNGLALTVRPSAGGTFYVDVRGTMHRSGTTCEFVNAVPSGGTSTTDQQGWAVRRFSVTVVDGPGVSFAAAVALNATTIELGQTFTISATVYNSGVSSDDGRIAVSFPGMTDPSDAQWVSSTSSGDIPGYLEHPAGATLTHASCVSPTASYLQVEYADGGWQGFNAESNTLALSVRPRAPGTFYFYVRATMHKSGTTCDFVNGLPANGEGGFFDQTGQPVRRFAVTVTNQPGPSFTTLLFGLSTYTIEIGQTFTVSASVANFGAESDDGRIAFSFPGLTDPADAQWVSSPSAGDTPGYLEHPAGSALFDSNCQPISASYLLVEYADDSWQGQNTESNAVSVTVQPKVAGTFTFYVRATMHRLGSDCEYVHAHPSGSGSAIDQQGWVVRPFTVTVLSSPVPEFTSFDPGLSTVELGQSFTIAAEVRNLGATSDDGRIAISFPGMTGASDAQWVSSTSSGDGPGYLEHPAGSAVTGAGCQPVTASYLTVEYADAAWQGLGVEINPFSVTVTPQAPGTFHFYVRSTMRKPGTACELANALPPSGAVGFTDQQGWEVRRFAVSVVDTPDPVFQTGVVLSASAIGLGQPITITTIVRNDGAASPDGRIAISFPALTDPEDAQWASSTSTGDAPGYLEHPAGSSLTDASCQAVSATYLLAEYADGDWSRFGTESNSFSVKVTPREIGTFYIYVRSTLRKSGPTPCNLVNELPADGEAGFVDQQGFPVKRYAVAVGATPPPPVPTFTSFVVSASGGGNSITLGQSITVSVGVRNDGGFSDDGRVVFSFHSACAVSMPGPDHPVGTTLLDASCQPVITTRAVSEFVDDGWETGELQSLQAVLTPQTAGTFTFDVRGTMHVLGAACAYSNAGPAGGSPATDELGWAVHRFSITVYSDAPSPAFAGPVTGFPASITFGSSFTFTASVRNEGISSFDGRLVVGFPQLIESTDGNWVSSGTGTSGDAPGYRELPAGSALTTASCQSVTAPYLVVEFVDQSWGGHDTPGADNQELNTLVLSVTPQTIGEFIFDVRATILRTSMACIWVNGVPVNGEGGYTDPQGWPVKRFRVLVTAPPVAYPTPVFPLPVEVSSSTINQGETIILRTRVRNDGTDSDQGIISVSFPTLTSGSDGQWITPLLSGDDTPGYQESPAGSVIPDAGCYFDPASYLTVEYVDESWKGILNGHERNELWLSIRPPNAGVFQINVRSAMRQVGTACTYFTALPSNGQAGFEDQQGWPVKRFAITVVAAPPPVVEPIPVFAAGPSGLPSSLTLGQSLTINMSVRNDGLASDDGRISVSFPTFTAPTDAQWVTSSSSGDTPGYSEYPAGSPLTDAGCQVGAASYLAVEYADVNWLGTGAEYNALSLTVVPRTVGVFPIDIRSTMHRSGQPPCNEVNVIPAGGAGTFTDQQGRTVRRFQVSVFAIPAPGAPSTTWTQLSPPGGGPAGRRGASFAYDEPRDELFLYGGAALQYFSDIWSLPLAPGSAWKETVPGGSPPLRRIMHSMIHNPVEGHFVFFGGYYNNLMDDLALLALRPVPWWFSIARVPPSPSPRIGHTATYDPVRHRMLLIGGYDNALHNDVWEYPLPGNGTWTKLEPIGGPMPARAQHTAVYDPVRDRVIVFGGDGGTFLNDVWELRLGVVPTWNRLLPTEIPPSGRREHTMVYDPDRDRMVIFAGFDGARRNDLWALSLADPPRWEELLSTTTPPSPRALHGAIYDRFRRRMVMFGGQVGATSFSNELWLLTDNAPTPALASLVSTECLPDRVRLTWAVAGAAPIRAEIHRSAGEAEGWSVIGSPEPKGDRLVFEDRDVTPGTRLGYRLVELESSGETVLNEVWVTVPLGLGLSLAGASPNPAEGELRVAFSLPAGGRASLELFDLRGRLLAHREVGTLGAGEHRVLFDEAGRMRAGVYLLRLVRGDQVLTAKACIIR